MTKEYLFYNRVINAESFINLFISMMENTVLNKEDTAVLLLDKAKQVKADALKLCEEYERANPD